MTKILVTGATGWLGRRLVAALNELGHSVFALARHTPKLNPLPPAVEFVQGDILKLDTLKRVMEKVEIVIHLAADMDFFPPQPELMYATNVDGTRNVLTAAASRGVRRFIYISSTEAMGASQSSDPRDEDGIANPEYDYGKSKQLAEESVRELAEREGIDYVILRPSGIFNDSENEFQLVWAANLGLFFFVPHGKRMGTATFTPVDDIVSGIVLAVESKTASRQTYILSGDSMSYSDIISTLNHACGRVLPLFAIPLPVAKLLLSLLAPVLRIPFGKRFLFESKTLDQLELYRSFSSKKAQQDLGWKAPQMKPAFQRHVQDLFRRRKLRRFPISPVFLALAALILVILFWTMLI